MDPIIQLLMTKYGLSPDTAKSYAAKILLGDDPQSSAMRGEAAQMQTASALDTMSASQTQMEMMKHFQQSDPVAAQAIQRAQDIMGQSAIDAGKAKQYAGAVDWARNQDNPAVHPDIAANYGPDNHFDQNAYDRADYEHRRANGQLDHYTQESVPGEIDDDTREAMRKDYLTSSTPKMDDHMRAAYTKAAAKSPQYMTVRLARSAGN